MTIVDKGWGYEKWICNSELYCGKLLFFFKEKKCSWHFHKLKDETFYLHSGKILLKYGFNSDILKSEEKILNPGDSFYIPPGLKHQMFALENSELYEFSTQHFDEDSYRLEKGD